MLEGIRAYIRKLDILTQGLVVCCCHSSNIGINGFSGTPEKFKAFTNSINQRSIVNHTFWLYFPINDGEFIRAAWVRRVKRMDGSGAMPILVIETSLGRTMTFGHHVPARLRHLYDYLPLVKNGDGVITGIFHNGLDPQASKFRSGKISVFGVTCNEKQYRSQALNPEPTPIHLDAPQLPGCNPGLAWYMTKARLEGLCRVRVCRDREELHQSCLGLLLYYEDGHLESLGQVRWDRDLEHEVLAPFRVENVVVGGKNYIKDVRKDAAYTGNFLKESKWQSVPRYGTLIWWFGHMGNRITIYHD
ncbi:hypothetical protein SI65_04614 [Aspergillus cristatus]|uniref:Uncharacterized protein n=1 Tax=Aspergillus cristatus TaxID=573508 RepID=A0A1E3BFB4_ASPCR|nr:hypothetical protein SI65_04614 [Aspergillus cristatus]